MAPIEHDHMIEQIVAAVANKALRDAVLPWALEAGSLGLDAQVPDRVNHLVIEICAPIEDQEASRELVGKGFAQLLDHPCTGAWSHGSEEFSAGHAR